MARFVLHRLVHAVVVVFAISVVTFLLLRLTPGDPARLVLGVHAPKSAVVALDHQLGLDRPVVQQYASWLSGLLHGRLGDSVSNHVPVSTLIGPRLVPSALLIAYALLIAAVVGIPVGVFAATRRNRLGDHAVRIAATVSFAMPAFWVSLLLVLLFSLWLKVFPLSGYGSGLGGHLASLTLPAVAVAMLMTPLVIRTARASVSETLSAEYVEAAGARGLSRPRILYKHALRNGIIPTVTLLGVAIGSLLGATVVVENVFAIPGLGSLLVSAVQARDFPVIQVLAVLFGVVVVLVNLLTDVLYVVIDPRVRL
jgi:peptide/nickel transport system permease protein